jgi:hypothetical protein
MEATGAGVKVVGPKDGKEGFLGSIRVRFVIDGLKRASASGGMGEPLSGGWTPPAL